MSYEITARTTWPYSTVCYIECVWVNGTVTRSSGVVVGLNDVLTAHHVVYNELRGGAPARILITPAADPVPTLIAPYGTFSNVSSINSRTLNWDVNGDQLVSPSEAQYDMALLGLSSPIGTVTGWSTPLAASADFQGVMAGYPARGSGLMAESVYADASASYALYEIDSGLGSGASGGPLFYGGSGEKQYVAGVLSSGTVDLSAATYAGFYGAGNWEWLQNAISSNDDLIQLPASSTDDYAAGVTTLGRIMVDGTVTGTLEVNTDSDWFAIELPGGVYRFDVFGWDGQGGTLDDPQLQLYTAGGMLLASDDDSGAGLDPTILATLGGGTYFLAVSSFPDSPSGTYTVKATSQAPSEIVGSAGPDSLVGTAAADTFYGGGGNDLLDGAGGTDTARYDGQRAGFTLARSGGAVTVQDGVGSQGTDQLVSIERVRFDNLTVHLDIGAKAAAVPAAQLQRLEELYVAFFNRVPEAEGLAYWIDRSQAGMSLNAIADAFYSAGVLYSAQTGYSAGMSNADFVRVIYRNVLGRTDGGDAEGVAYWSARLASGADTRGTLVSAILDSAHSFKGRSDYGWVADLLDNKAVVADLYAVDMGLSPNDPTSAIQQGMAIAAAVTATSTAAAVALIGVNDGFVTA